LIRTQHSQNSNENREEKERKGQKTMGTAQSKRDFIHIGIVLAIDVAILLTLTNSLFKGFGLLFDYESRARLIGAVVGVCIGSWFQLDYNITTTALEKQAAHLLIPPILGAAIGLSVGPSIIPPDIANFFFRS